MKPTLNPVLSEINAHPRDTNIQFYEEDHKYIILTEIMVYYKYFVDEVKFLPILPY